MMDFLSAAERYVRLGFKVFPLKPLSKVPLTEHGVLDATDDMDVLAHYVRNHPDANIAVGCGPDSGITVIDVDRHHGGVESLKELIKKHGDIPQCPMAQTPQGGFHLYLGNDTRIGNSVGVLAKGVDVKSQGGYVVLPPSYWDGFKMKRGKDGKRKRVQVCDGGTYKWLRAPLGSRMPVMPAWILKLLLPKPMPKFAPKHWDKTNTDLAQVAKALKFIPNYDYGTWTMAGMALKLDFGAAGYDLWCDWSATGYADYSPQECGAKWKSFKRGDGVHVASIFHAARQAGADLKNIFKERGNA